MVTVAVGHHLDDIQVAHHLRRHVQDHADGRIGPPPWQLACCDVPLGRRTADSRSGLFEQADAALLLLTPRLLADPENVTVAVRDWLRTGKPYLAVRLRSLSSGHDVDLHGLDPGQLLPWVGKPYAECTQHAKGVFELQLDGQIADWLAQARLYERRRAEDPSSPQPELVGAAPGRPSYGGVPTDPRGHRDESDLHRRRYARLPPRRRGGLPAGAAERRPEHPAHPRRQPAGRVRGPVQLERQPL